MRHPNAPADVFKLIDMTAGSTACWTWRGTWGGPKRERRPYFSVSGKRYIAARLVYELVNGPIPDRKLVLHNCDNGSYPIGCCNPAHLRVGTEQENMDDMTERQRHGLPHRVIRAIRRLLENGRTYDEIADLYGITHEVVGHIASRRTYANVPDEEPTNAEG